MLKIIRAGMLTSVQDLGRQGFRQSGVSGGGAMDTPALRIANLLVGNPQGAAALEITLGQATFEFTCNGWFALTGAGCDARLDGKPIWTGWRQPFRRGQQLVLNQPKRGMRSYLAVAGGFEVADVMGSASTDLNGGFGGLQGRALQDGDSLAIIPGGKKFKQPRGVRQPLWGNRIRAMPGPEFDDFTPATQENFYRLPWYISPQSNRMGYRLEGQHLELETPRELVSHGLMPGVVQVPANGQPIVLMQDAQTTGGYPRIACVIESDLYHLAQVRLGEPIHFVFCTLEEAFKARREQTLFIENIAWHLGLEE